MLVLLSLYVRCSGSLQNLRLCCVLTPCIRTKQLLMTGVFSLCVLPSFSCSPTQSGNSGTPTFPLQIDLKGDFKPMAEKIKANKTFRTYEWGEDFLVINTYSGLSPDAAKDFMENKKFLVESLYEEQVSPYPGALSEYQRLPAGFSP